MNLPANTQSRTPFRIHEIRCVERFEPHAFAFLECFKTFDQTGDISILRRPVIFVHGHFLFTRVYKTSRRISPTNTPNRICPLSLDLGLPTEIPLLGRAAPKSELTHVGCYISRAHRGENQLRQNRTDSPLEPWPVKMPEWIQPLTCLADVEGIWPKPIHNGKRFDGDGQGRE